MRHLSRSAVFCITFAGPVCATRLRDPVDQDSDEIGILVQKRKQKNAVKLCSY